MLTDLENILNIMIPIIMRLIPINAGVSRTWSYLRYPISAIRNIPIPLHIA